jgi:iron complex outermembrane receptor protein
MASASRLAVVVGFVASLERPSAAEERLPQITVWGAGPSADGPPTVTVVPGEVIDAIGIGGVRDLGAVAPSFVVSPAGDRKSSFLGVRGLSNATLGETSVGVYVDGIPYTDIRGALLDLYDVDRIELFRGPQTTRFGRNAESGAIDVRTVAPGNLPRARGTVRLGDFDEQVYQASLSGPLVPDRVFVGLAGLKSSRDGFIRNTFLHDDLDDRDVAGGRGQVVILPFPGLKLALFGEGAHADDGGQALVALDAPDPFEVARDVPGASKLDTTVGALRLRYETEDVVVTALTARRSFDSFDNTDDLDFSPAPIGVVHDDHRFTDWTQEVRIGSRRPDARWRWQLGGFFEDKTTEPSFAAQVFAETPPLRERYDARYDARTWAGFGDATFAVVPGLDLTAGLRVEYYRVEMRRDHVAGPIGQRPAPIVPTIRTRQDAVTWLPHVRLGWWSWPRVRLHAGAARGYRPGGFSFLIDDPVAARFQPSVGWTYEVGAVVPWLENRLVTGLTLYWARVRDYQNAERVGLAGFTVRNAARVTTRGVEGEVTANLLPGLDVDLHGGVIDAQYDRFCVGGDCFDGNTVALAPDYEFGLAILYRHPSGLVAEVGCRGLGAYPFLKDNARGQTPYQLVSARLGWEWRYFGIYAYGRNLADATYFPFAIAPTGPPGYLTTPGDPRTVGVMLVARY